MPTLFDVMHSHFSTNAASSGISQPALDAIPQLPRRSFPPISQKEIWDALAPTSSSSAPGPDHVTWRHIKMALCFPDTDIALAGLFNAVCTQGIWPMWFKESLSVIIPKPNKPDYSISKAYRPIALLNTLGKLLTKILANRLQHDAAAFGLLHPGQFGGIQKHATIDAGLVLMDYVNKHRERGWHSSVCAIDVAQFFPSLSHAVMSIILERLGFSPIIVAVIKSYFSDQVTEYRWDNTCSKPYNFSLGTPQGDCLSPILSALYISIAIKKVFPAVLPPPKTKCLFYVDDGVIITASPSLQENIRVLKRHLLALLQALYEIGLQVEASKTELMHFFAFQLSASRCLNITSQPTLRFSWQSKEFVVKPATVWRYLGFFFTPTLDFSYHVQFYTNKAFSTIRACGMLGNSLRGLGTLQRAHTYNACILLVLTYGLPLWYSLWGTGISRLVKKMERVHSFALAWIIGAFRSTPIGAREIIAGIPPLKIILNMRIHGLTSRLLTLGEGHLLHQVWTTRWLHKAIARVAPRRHARHLPCDNPLTRLSALGVQEIFMPFHEASRPGEQVADLFPDRLFFDLSAPKRSSKFFDKWVSDFVHKIDSLKQSGRSLLFSDGAYWSKTARLAYAFAAFHTGSWVDKYGWCPAGSSYDAEIAALKEAIEWALTNDIQHPVFFVDNKAVLKSFLDMSTHSSQMSSIRINILISDFLTRFPLATLSFTFCPSHVSIAGNDRADLLTKLGAAMGPSPPIRVLHSNFVNDF